MNATAGSLVTATEKLPTPRMKVTFWVPTLSIVSAGTSLLSALAWVMPAEARSAPPTTSIAIAAFCEFSDRRCAVTITSWRPIAVAPCELGPMSDELRTEVWSGDVPPCPAAGGG